MAKKTNNNNSNNNNNNGPRWPSLNKISFWLIVAAAVLLLIGIIMKFIPSVSAAAGWLLSIVTACMVCVVAVLAYRYVRNKPTIWLVLYIVTLLVVLAGIVIPAL